MRAVPEVPKGCVAVEAEYPETGRVVVLLQPEIEVGTRHALAAYVPPLLFQHLPPVFSTVLFSMVDRQELDVLFATTDAVGTSVSCHGSQLQLASTVLGGLAVSILVCMMSIEVNLLTPQTQSAAPRERRAALDAATFGS